MSALAIRLESFSQSTALDTTTEEPFYNEEEAFQRGFSAGEKQAHSVTLNDLIKSLNSVNEKLIEEALEQKKIRRNILSSLSPILKGILEIISPISIKEKLDQVISQEMARLIEAAPYKRCIIKCQLDLSDIVSAHLKLYDTSLIRVDATPDFSGVEVSTDGGTVAFDPVAVLENISRLINEITLED